jgi:hypothetical protein
MTLTIDKALLAFSKVMLIPIRITTPGRTPIFLKGSSNSAWLKAMFTKFIKKKPAKLPGSVVSVIKEAAEEFMTALLRQRLGMMGHAHRHKLLAPEDISEEFADCQERMPAVSWYDRKAWRKAVRLYKGGYEL